MTDEEEKLTDVAEAISAAIIDNAKELVEEGGGALVVIVEFPLGTGHALGLGGNKINDAPRMLYTALLEVPGGIEYVAMMAEAHGPTKH